MQWLPKNNHDPLSILEWLFLPHQYSKTIVTICEQIAQLINKGHLRTVELTGKDPNTIYVPLTKQYLTWALHNRQELQICQAIQEN